MLLTANVQAEHRVTQIVGDAYDLESGELLYRETHCISPDARERKVFAPGSRRLIRYRGPSSIGDGEGSGFVVDLRYDYGNVPEGACEVIEQSLALVTTS